MDDALQQPGNLKLAAEMECCKGWRKTIAIGRHKMRKEMQTITELCWYSASQDAFHVNANKSFFLFELNHKQTTGVTNAKRPARSPTQTLIPERYWMQPKRCHCERCITWRRSICYGPLELLRKTPFLLGVSMFLIEQRAHWYGTRQLFCSAVDVPAQKSRRAGEGHQATEQGNSNRKFGAIQSDAIESVRRQNCKQRHSPKSRAKRHIPGIAELSLMLSSPI